MRILTDTVRLMRKKHEKPVNHVRIPENTMQKVRTTVTLLAGVSR
jgi:hypothetical protein